MSAPNVIIVTNGTLSLADTEGGLAAGDTYTCQVTEAAINATPNLQTVPATFCEPESQSPAATGYELEVTWLQDWTASGGGLSNYAFVNDATTKFFSLKLETGDVVATGQVRIVAGAYGGAAGTPLTTTATWPLASTPSIGDPFDLTFDIFGRKPAGFADLAELKADVTEYGDGELLYNLGADFASDEFVWLDDISTAHYSADAWVVGSAP